MPRPWAADNLIGGGMYTFDKVIASGAGRGHRFDFLTLLAFTDKVTLFDDFIMDSSGVPNADIYLNTNAGTSASMGAPATQQSGGVIEIIPGTGDNETATCYTDLIWTTNKNLVGEVSVAATVNTNVKFEFGFSNLAARNTAIVNAYDTPSYQSNQTNVLVGIIDTDGTNGDRWKLCTDGTTTNMNATGTQSGEAIGAAASALTTSVINTFDTITLTGIGARSRLYRNGKSLAHHGATLASRVNVSVLEAAALVAVARNGTNGSTILVDYLLVSQDR